MHPIDGNSGYVMVGSGGWWDDGLTDLVGTNAEKDEKQHSAQGHAIHGNSQSIKVDGSRCLEDDGVMELVGMNTERDQTEDDSQVPPTHGTSQSMRVDGSSCFKDDGEKDLVGINNGTYEHDDGSQAHPIHCNSQSLMVDGSSSSEADGAKDLVGENTGRWNRRAYAQAYLQQPRATLVAQLLSEYGHFVECPCIQRPTMDCKLRTLTAFAGAPPGSRLVAVRKSVGEHWQKFSSSMALCACSKLHRGSSRSCCTYLLGVYRTPCQWHAAACRLEFPMDRAWFARPWQAEAVVSLLSHSPSEVAVMRSALLRRLVQMKENLKAEEASLHAGLHADVARIVAGKSLLLFRHVLRELGVDDTVFCGMRDGFRLVGKVPNFGVLAACDMQDGTFTKEELLATSRARLRHLLLLTRSTGNLDDDRMLIDETRLEVQRGWAEGPFTAQQLDARFGNGAWVAARRFGIWQSSAGTRKFRLIDDYTAPGHNQSTWVDQRLDHGGLDEVASLVRCLGRSLHSGWVDITDTNGFRWTCPVHDAWFRVKFQPFIRTIDLRSAYKQLPVHPSDADVAITCAFHPDEGKPMFWRTLAMPFGARSSVFCFNACSRVLEMFFNRFGWMPSCSYFDDFPFAEPEATTGSARCLAEALLKLLGWVFDNRGHKYQNYAQQAV
eukprot:6490773-Amphidinium_carterae.2